MVKLTLHRGMAVTLAAVALLTGCGTRVDHDAILAGAGGGTVTLAPDSVHQVRDAVTPRRAGATAPAPATSVAPQTPRTDGRPPPAAPRVAPSTGSAPAGGTAPAAVAACAQPAAPVAVGQVGTFSGVAGPITAAARAMVAAWAADLNTRGGLACHPVRVFAEDDGGDPQKAAAAVHELVDRHHVVALVANMVPFSVSGFRSAVEAVRVPAIGGESGTSDFFDSPWFFPAGSSAADQALGMVRNGVQAGHPKLGILYCVESSGCTQIFHALHDSAPAVTGAQVVDASPVSLVQTDYTAQCLNARKAGADQLALAMDGASMIRVARSCAAVGYRPLLSAVATQLSAAQSTDATLRRFGLATATPTAPWLLSDSAALAAYNRVLARYAPGVTPDADSMNAWAAVQLLEAAVAPTDVPLTAASVVAGLGRIRQDTLGGLTGPLTFHAGQAHATSSGCVFFETLGPQGWAAPRGRAPVCLPRH